MKKGLLLINLGTPASLDAGAVKSYLKEFLSDPRVIAIPSLLRFLLVRGLVIPFRYKNTLHAYQTIWQESGSPLMIHSLALEEKLQQKLGDNYQVALAMRYGKPDIATALTKLKHCDAITLLPLYPQYSSAATGSSLEKSLAILKDYEVIPSIKVIRDFYNHPAYINSLAQKIKPSLTDSNRLLLSYHGLPEFHIKKSGCETLCNPDCDTLKRFNPSCYRGQCYETSRLVAQALNLTPPRVITTFQSRLGKTPWIKPYTDECLKDLANSGVKDLVVACPSFVADCLETLEEIGIRGREIWQEHGGQSYKLIPCLNSDDSWVEALSEIISISL